MIIEKLAINTSRQQRVSVIIPTRNSSRTIEPCIRSIKHQTHQNIEVIIVDGNSSDDTASIAKSHDATVVTLDSERTKAKNLGTSYSSGDYVLFLDSDMVLEPSVIENCMKLCSEDEKAAGVIIPERSVGSGYWVKVRDFERSFYEGTRIESARFFKKDLVEKVGGFDESVVFFEESTLPQKIEALGLRVNARIGSCIFHDENGFKLGKWLNKKKYYVNSAKAYSAKYDGYANNQMSISYRVNAFISNGKWRRLFRHPILAVGLFTLKGLEYIYSKSGQK